ncbi:hypothetical protein ABPG75_003386 [Micractinium tetrahymenae]
MRLPVLLDERESSVNLPSGVRIASVKDATSAVEATGAAWCWVKEVPRINPLTDAVSCLAPDEKGLRRVFLSPIGWEQGGSIGSSAALLAIGAGLAPEKLSQEELPASLVLGGWWQLQAQTDPQVSVALSGGRSIQLPVSPTTTGASLDSYVASLLHCPAHNLRLVFSGKQLEDDRFLRKCNIQDQTTLHLLLRLRGGMLHETSGRAGSFECCAAAEASEAAGGRVPVEVVLPDGEAVLLECKEEDGSEQVVAQLRRRLSHRSLLALDVDGMCDMEAMRSALREAQAALQGSFPS